MLCMLHDIWTLFNVMRSIFHKLMESSMWIEDATIRRNDITIWRNDFLMISLWFLEWFVFFSAIIKYLFWVTINPLKSKFSRNLVGIFVRILYIENFLVISPFKSVTSFLCCPGGTISWNLLIQLAIANKTYSIQTLLYVCKREKFHSLDPFNLFHLLHSY